MISAGHVVKPSYSHNLLGDEPQIADWMTIDSFSEQLNSSSFDGSKYAHFLNTIADFKM